MNRPRKQKGLGDMVHAVAQPIAKAIDALAGTRLSKCRACARRRQSLNRLTDFMRRRSQYLEVVKSTQKS